MVKKDTQSESFRRKSFRPGPEPSDSLLNAIAKLQMPSLSSVLCAIAHQRGPLGISFTGGLSSFLEVRSLASHSVNRTELAVGGGFGWIWMEAMGIGFVQQMAM